MTKDFSFAQAFRILATENAYEQQWLEIERK